MTEIFIYLLFGHFVGDYLLQNSWMAFHKKVIWAACFTHCLVYTATVGVFLLMSPQIHTVDLNFIVMLCWIFLSHWVLDRYELVDWWFKKLEIRSWNNFEGELEDHARLYDSVIISFGAIVYTVSDNILHIIMMWFIIKGFYG